MSSLTRRALGLLVVVAACQNGSYLERGETDIQEGTDIDFTSYETAAEGPRALTISRTPEGEAVVTGTLETPNPCFDLRAAFLSDASEPTLRLVAEPQDGECIQVIGSFNFSATIERFPPDMTELVVIYEYPGTNWDTQTMRVGVPAS